jgi:predicted TIM-barrel fold metal-dependent hydrolase
MTLQPDRRSFLATAAAATVSLTAAEGKPMLSIIDTHVHLWNRSQFQLPWLKPDMPFFRDYGIDDYLKAAAGGELSKAVYMEVDVARNQKQAEANWIRGICEKGGTPFVAAIVGGDPAASGFADYARQFQNDPYIKGIRQVLHVPETPSGYAVKQPFVTGVSLLGDLGLTFDLCIRSSDLPVTAELVKQCPKTRFVLDHCGNPDLQAADLSPWKRDLAELAKQPNVIVKLSGILVTASDGWKPADLAPVVNHTLDSFGPDRVIFASDWPVCTKGGTWRQWLDAVATIVKDRPAAEQRKLFHDNAATFYGLKG